MRLSVIIPTFNRAEMLRDCLASLVKQSLGTEAFEVIVVDNGSMDHTEKVVCAYSDSLRLVYSRKENPGLHVGRHEGLRLSRSELLVFADDDTKAEPEWLNAICRSFDDPTVAMVGGNNYPAFHADPPDWLLRLWERPVYRGHALSSLSVLDFGEGQFEIDPGYVWGCNFSIRRDILKLAGGFHPDAVPEQKLRYRGDGETHVSNFVRALGMKAMFNSDASVCHMVPSSRMTRDYFCHRHYAQGISDSYSAVRAAGGLPGYRARLMNRARIVRDYVHCALGHMTWRNDPVESALAKVLRSSQQAYWEGYRFHSREVTNDPSLLAWVLRESYI